GEFGLHRFRVWPERTGAPGFRVGDAGATGELPPLSTLAAPLRRSVHGGSARRMPDCRGSRRIGRVGVGGVEFPALPRRRFASTGVSRCLPRCPGRLGHRPGVRVTHLSVTMQIDLNCDLGEGGQFDAELMSMITTANVACGFHAGSPREALVTVQLAARYGVR